MPQTQYAAGYGPVNIMLLQPWYFAPMAFYPLTASWIVIQLNNVPELQPNPQVNAEPQEDPNEDVEGQILQEGLAEVDEDDGANEEDYDPSIRPRAPRAFPNNEDDFDDGNFLP